MPKKPNRRSGIKGNKSKLGLPAYNAEELMTRKIDSEFLTRYLLLNSHLPEKELKRKLKDPNVSNFEGIIIGNLLKLRKSPDMFAFDKFLERLVGKVPTIIKAGPINRFDHMSDEELLLMKKQYAEENLKTLKLLEAEKQQVEQQPSVIDIKAKTSAAK